MISAGWVVVGKAPRDLRERTTPRGCQLAGGGGEGGTTHPEVSIGKYPSEAWSGVARMDLDMIHRYAYPSCKERDEAGLSS